MKYEDSPLWREDLERQVAGQKRRIAELEETLDAIEGSGLAGGPLPPSPLDLEGRVERMRLPQAPHRHQTVPGRVSLVIRGHA